MIGFVFCGLGLANAVPLLFSAAGRVEPSGPSLAAAFTLGYTGFIVGPPTIGILSDQIGLPRTLILLLLAALTVAALGARAVASKPAARFSPPSNPRPRLQQNAPRSSPDPLTFAQAGTISILAGS